MQIKASLRAVRRALLPSFLALVVCCSLLLGWSGVAQANNEAGKVMQEQAERELDRMSGAGTSEQIKGTAQEQMGRAQKNLGNEVEGTAKQVQGKVQKGIGQTKQAAEDAADAASDSAEGLVDKVKDLFD